MKKTFKFITIWFTSFAFLFLGITPVAAAKKTGTIDYVALGDSIAAGVRAVSDSGDPTALPGWEDGSDEGYTDEIARWLAGMGQLKSFDEKFSISGYTADELAKATSKGYLVNKLKNAEIVTITIGANDVIQPLYDYYFNLVNGVPQEATLESALTDCANYLEYGYDENGPSGAEMLAEDLGAIFSNILTVNPTAHIYVMGYFHPLPYLAVIDPDLNTPTTTLVYALNSIIETTVNQITGASISYIDTVNPINGGAISLGYGSYYLSAPMFAYTQTPPYLYYNHLIPMADIHPTEAGYEMLAESFEDVIAGDFGF